MKISQPNDTFWKNSFIQLVCRNKTTIKLSTINSHVAEKKRLSLNSTKVLSPVQKPSVVSNVKQMISGLIRWFKWILKQLRSLLAHCFCWRNLSKVFRIYSVLYELNDGFFWTSLCKDIFPWKSVDCYLIKGDWIQTRIDNIFLLAVFIVI